MGVRGGRGMSFGLLRAQFTFILIYLLKIMVPIIHLPQNYSKLLGIKMLYVKDNFCVIDKYLKKNDEKFKYFSLKYNITSKSVKFFLFFELVW